MTDRPEWAGDRPATVVCADPRIFPPGHFHRNDGGDNSSGAGENGHPFRAIVEEQATLQGFRPGYPFQGTPSERHRQVGDAVPPPLARAVVAALVRPGRDVA